MEELHISLYRSAIIEVFTRYLDTLNTFFNGDWLTNVGGGVV